MRVDVKEIQRLQNVPLEKAIEERRAQGWKCPHCLIAIPSEPYILLLGSDSIAGWAIVQDTCPSCKRFIFHLANGRVSDRASGRTLRGAGIRMVYPHAPSRGPVPKQVPSEIAQDYKEACLVLADSSRAAAALARRCLQHLIRSRFNITRQDLFSEIGALLDLGTLPSYISDDLHAVRELGNVGAHPLRCAQTGEILPVEPREAEWTLNVLEALFDFCFVQPAKAAARRAALEQKLQHVEKPPRPKKKSAGSGSTS